MRNLTYKRFFFRIICIGAGVIFSIKGFVADDILDTYSRCGLIGIEGQSSSQDFIKDGRLYYDSLVKKSARRRWAVPVTVNYSFGNNAFDCAGQDTDFATGLLGGAFTVADVSLFCRLSAENKVRIINKPALGFDRGGIPITDGAPFGAYRDDLVSTLVAPIQIGFGADRQIFGCDVTGLYRWWFGPEDQFMLTTGITLPFKSIKYGFNPSFVGGSLYRDAFTAGQTKREDTGKQFFREYSSIEDFFIRGILGKKSITFNKSTQQSGIGDITLFSLIDCAQCFPKAVQLMQAGVALIVPSGGSINQDILFPATLGQGCFAADLFVNMLFNSSLQAFNPFIRGALEISAPFAFSGGGVRVPLLVTQNQTRVMVKNVPGLKTIDVRLQNFEDYWVDSFSEYDTTIPALSDNTVSAVSVRQGTQFVLGVGNYSYNVAYTKARLELLYSYMYRQANSVGGSVAGVDTASLTQNSSAQSHTVSWSLSWPGKIVDCFVGSEHVFAGQNVVRNNRLFIVCSATF